MGHDIVTYLFYNILSELINIYIFHYYLNGKLVSLNLLTYPVYVLFVYAYQDTWSALWLRDFIVEPSYLHLDFFSTPSPSRTATYASPVQIVPTFSPYRFWIIYICACFTPSRWRHWSVSWCSLNFQCVESSGSTHYPHLDCFWTMCWIGIEILWPWWTLPKRTGRLSYRDHHWAWMSALRSHEIQEHEELLSCRSLRRCYDPTNQSSSIERGGWGTYE